MRYFIKSVNTIATTGKSKKGALLQTIAKRFEHTVLKGDAALAYFVDYLQALVDTCNAAYRGKAVTLHFDHDSCYIYAKNDNNGHEAYVFSISYAPIVDEFYFYEVPGTILGPVENLCGRKFATDIEAAAKTLCRQKGGEQ